MCIDLNRIRNNIERLRAGTRVKFMQMVKADAYGHGLTEVAKATEDIVDAYGVATLEEGVKLREYGIKKPILVLICAPYEIKTAIDNKLTIGLADATQLNALEGLISSGEVKPDKVKLHIALDSGMHRLGFSYRQLDYALNRLKEKGIKVGGIYSHLRVRSYAQIACFEKACKKVRAMYPNAVRHLASSHSFEYDRLRYDMVRVGLSAYEGAMRVESEVIASRRVKAGEFVSYGDYKVDKDTNTAVVLGGYADGAVREKPSAVYIRGAACRVLGKVCMDMCIVDCGDFLPSVGEKAVFTDGDRIREISKQRGSVEYTLMTCWHGRAERIYDDESGSEASCESGGCDVERG